MYICIGCEYQHLSEHSYNYSFPPSWPYCDTPNRRVGLPSPRQFSSPLSILLKLLSTIRVLLNLTSLHRTTTPPSLSTRSNIHQHTGTENHQPIQYHHRHKIHPPEIDRAVKIIHSARSTVVCLYKSTCVFTSRKQKRSGVDGDGVRVWQWRLRCLNMWSGEFRVENRDMSQISSR